MKKNKPTPGFWLGFGAWIVIIMSAMAMAALFILALAMVIELIGLL